MKTEMEELRKKLMETGWVFNNRLSISDRINAMDKSIKMAKEIFGQSISQLPTYGIQSSQIPSTDELMSTAKQIYDWLIQ